MTKEALKIQLAELFPAAAFDESGEWLNMTVAATDFAATAKQLRYEAALHFDYMFCLTCVDWKTNLTMVYHLTSTTHRQPVVVKVQLDRNKPEVASIAHIWRTAEFHEREVYERNVRSEFPQSPGFKTADFA